MTPHNPLSPDPRQATPGGGAPRGGSRERLAQCALWAAGLLLAGCSMKTPQSTLDPHGLVARDQLALFWTTIWVSLFIFVTVGGAMAWVVWKFREKPGDKDKPMPEQGHGNPMIEISLITASIALLVIIAVPTLKAIFLTDALPTNEPFWKPSTLGQWYAKVGPVPETQADKPLQIVVRGKQWWWVFEYPQFGITTANEFVMPAGKVVVFDLRSDNVIHSFWLPKIAGKVDLIPGRANWMWMMPDDGQAATADYDHGPLGADKYENGLYYGQCAQYCGESHAFMLFRSRVVSDQDFAQWVTDSQKKVPAPAAAGDWPKFIAGALGDPTKGRQPDTSMLSTEAQRGAALFFGRANCVKCHSIYGSPAAATGGPNLTRVASRTSIAAGFLDNLDNNGEKIDPARQEDNFFNWISHPYDYKPGNLMWYVKGGLGDIVAANEANHTPITKQDWHDLAAFLMTLK